jgi:hypothetical protein
MAKGEPGDRDIVPRPVIYGLTVIASLIVAAFEVCRWMMESEEHVLVGNKEDDAVSCAAL